MTHKSGLCTKCCELLPVAEIWKPGFTHCEHEGGASRPLCVHEAGHAVARMTIAPIIYHRDYAFDLIRVRSKGDTTVWVDRKGRKAGPSEALGQVEGLGWYAPEMLLGERRDATPFLYRVGFSREKLAWQVKCAQLTAIDALAGGIAESIYSHKALWPILTEGGGSDDYDHVLNCVADYTPEDDIGDEVDRLVALTRRLVRANYNAISTLADLLQVKHRVTLRQAQRAIQRHQLVVPEQFILVETGPFDDLDHLGDHGARQIARLGQLQPTRIGRTSQHK